jgi:hypothetical protein
MTSEASLLLPHRFSYISFISFVVKEFATPLAAVYSIIHATLSLGPDRLFVKGNITLYFSPFLTYSMSFTNSEVVGRVGLFTEAMVRAERVLEPRMAKENRKFRPCITPLNLA